MMVAPSSPMDSAKHRPAAATSEGVISGSVTRHST
jgi:hypothetical protein